MILAIVQARMNSTRLPGKVMKKILRKPLIGYLLERLGKSKKVNKIVIASSRKRNNDELCKYVKRLGLDVYRGEEDDVLDRYYQAASQFNPDAIVRISGDCPLIDYKVIDRVISYYLKGNFDYVSNVNPPTYPDGLDTEVFSFKALEEAWKNAKLKSEREHVTPYIINSGKFKIGNVRAENDFSSKRWTVDNEEDFILISKIIENLYKENSYFDMYDILKFENKNPELFEINKHIKRNEGLQKSLENDREI